MDRIMIADSLREGFLTRVDRVTNWTPVARHVQLSGSNTPTTVVADALARQDFRTL
jgi:hypothetical protein